MWKALRPFTALFAQARRARRKTVGEVLHRLREQPSREDVIHAFRLILGREPEDESVIDAHVHLPSVAELRRVLLSSEEFHYKYEVMHPRITDHPSESVGRDTLLFIHLQKTGGTSLSAVLAKQFPAERRCPVREDALHLLTVAELGRYDFFAGHFDRTSIRFIPRDQIKTVAMFRDPRARLISCYRFWRSHPVRDEFAHIVGIRLANELSAEEFFERPEMRTYAEVYNHYLVALGGSFSWFARNHGSLSKKDLSLALEEAKRQIRALTALGITERFEESVELICRALGLPAPPAVEALHVTDNFAALDPRFRRVDPVTMTPRLAAALEDLTVYDQELYRFAIDEFERRCAG